MQANECVNKRKNRQSSGATEPLRAHWMARPGAQKWAAKDEWGSHSESHSQQEPGTLAESQISGLGWRGKDQEGSLQAGGPCQHLPQGAGPHLPGVPLLPACPVGLEILEDPVGGERVWRSPLCRSKCNTEESAYKAGDLGSIRGSGRFPWRREWQPPLVLLPGESHGQRSPGGLQSTGSQRIGHN